MKTFEIHPREYTVLGISAVFQEIVSKKFIDYFGGTFSETLCVIKDGIFYHCEPSGEREKNARSFLKLINESKIDLDKEQKIFRKDLEDFRKIMRTPTGQYSIDLIRKFYRPYRNLIKIAYAAFDTLDYIHDLKSHLRNPYTKWVTNIRLKAENIYKQGEVEFIPSFTQWLSEKYFKNYSSEQLQFVFYKEMEDFIDSSTKLPPPRDLDNRKKLFVVRQFPTNNYELFTGSGAKKIINKYKLFYSEVLNNPSEIKGQIAFKGAVKGRVRLIFGRVDMQSFKDGEIIVSPMTDPSYLPIMRKATAFITDEGGTLCHAAIVARELKKPCIIGTKIATKIFKDGDLVEVDATRGIIKLIENKMKGNNDY